MKEYRHEKAFGIEMVKEIRKRTGSAFPVMYRIDLSLVLNETYKQRMKEVKSLKKFRNEIALMDPGSSVKLKLIRDNKTRI